MGNLPGKNEDKDIAGKLVGIQEYNKKTNTSTFKIEEKINEISAKRTRIINEYVKSFYTCDNFIETLRKRTSIKPNSQNVCKNLYCGILNLEKCPLIEEISLRKKFKELPAIYKEISKNIEKYKPIISSISIKDIDYMEICKIPQRAITIELELEHYPLPFILENIKFDLTEKKLANILLKINKELENLELHNFTLEKISIFDIILNPLNNDILLYKVHDFQKYNLAKSNVNQRQKLIQKLFDEFIDHFNFNSSKQFENISKIFSDYLQYTTITIFDTHQHVFEQNILEDEIENSFDLFEELENLIKDEETNIQFPKNNSINIDNEIYAVYKFLQTSFYLNHFDNFEKYIDYVSSAEIDKLMIPKQFLFEFFKFGAVGYTVFGKYERAREIFILAQDYLSAIPKEISIDFKFTLNLNKAYLMIEAGSFVDAQKFIIKAYHCSKQEESTVENFEKMDYHILNLYTNSNLNQIKLKLDTQLDLAITFVKKFYTKSDREYLKFYYFLTDYYLMKGKFDKFNECCELIEKILNNDFGGDHPLLAHIYFKKGSLNINKSTQIAAFDLLQTSLNSMEIYYGIFSKQFHNVLNKLILGFIKLGYYKKAEDLIIKSFNECVLEFGEKSSILIEILNNFAMINFHNKKYGDALESLEYAIKLAKRKASMKFNNHEAMYLKKTKNNNVTNDLSFYSGKSVSLNDSSIQYSVEISKYKVENPALENKIKDLSFSINNYSEELNEEIQESHELLSLCNNIAIVYSELGMQSEAKEYVDIAFKLAKSIKGRYKNNYENSSSFYSVLSNFGTTKMEMGKKEEALQFFETCMKHLQNINFMQVGLLSSAANCLLSYSNKGNVSKVKEIGDFLITSIEGQFGKHDSILASTYSIVGAIYIEFEEFQSKGYILLLKSLEIYKSLPNTSEIIYQNLYNNIGMACFKEGKLAECKEYYNKALDILQNHSVQNLEKISIVKNNLANYYALIEDNHTAEKFFKESIRIKEKINGKFDLSLSYSLNNLANLYSSVEKYDKAIAIYKRILKIRNKCLTSYHSKVWSIIRNLYVNLNMKGDLEEFGKIIDEQMLRIKLIHGESSFEYGCGLLRISEILFSSGKYKESKEIIEKSIKILEKDTTDSTFKCELERAIDILNSIQFRTSNEETGGF